MRYGACSWVFGDQDIETTAAFLAEAGFDGVELKGDLSLYKPNAVNATLRANGLQVLSLTPDNVDLAQPDVELRSRAIEYYLRLLDFAAAVGAPLETRLRGDF